MKLYSLFLILILSLTNFVSAQNKKIIKIIDSNLYMLEDSTLIKLAGVDVPSRNQTDEYLEEIANDIYFYAFDNFLNRPLEIIYAGEDEHYPGTKLVVLNKMFLLSKMNYNEYFLERGFGRFIKNSNLIKDSTYLSAEATAKENYSGIWKYTDLDSLGILDRSNSHDGYSEEFNITIDQPFVYDRSFSRILLEIPIGALGGAAAGAPFSLLALGFAGSYYGDESVYFAAIGYVGYVFGNSLGVYLVAKGGNKDLSLGYTFLTSSLFGAAGYVIYTSLKETDRNLEVIAPLVFPLIGALIYVNAIGYPQEQYDGPTDLDFSNNHNHSTFINSNSIKFNLFKINF